MRQALATYAYLLSALALCACSSGSSAPADGALPGLRGTDSVTDTGRMGNVPARPSDSTIFVLTCGYYSGECDVRNSQGKILYKITGLSNGQGGATGPISWYWYIANTGASGVAVYAIAKSGKPTFVKTIADSGEYPVNVAVSEKGKNGKVTSSVVAISNIFTTGGAAGSVTVIRGNKTYSLADKNAYQGIGITFDGKGNCYWSFNEPSGGGRIDEFPGCAGKAKTLRITTGFAGGLAFDGKDDLWYADQLKGVYKCKGTNNCALVSSWNFTDALTFDFSADFTTLYVNDAGSETIDRCSVGGSCSVFLNTGDLLSALLPAAVP